ncbi:MAG: GNAT family N-acetyltransferase [Colwellia sp.]
MMYIAELLREDYLDQATNLFNQYRKFYGQKKALKLVKEFISSRLSNNDSTTFIVREKDVVRFMQIYPTFSSIRAENSLILDDLYVVPDFRGKGVGQLLIDAATSYCQKIKAKGLALPTATGNLDSARAL